MRWSTSSFRTLAVVGVAVLAACSSSGPSVVAERAPGSTAAPTTTVATTSSTTSTSTTTTSLLPPTSLAPSATCASTPEYRQPDPNRPSYFVAIQADPKTGLVTGAQQVVFRPDLPVDRLVFRLWPNGPRPASVGTSLDVTEPTYLDGTPLYFDRPDPTTFVIFLPEELGPGGEVTVQFRWTLRIGGASNDRFSWAQGSIRMGSFLPLLAWQPGVGWAEEPPTSGFAESTTSPVARWSYTVAADSESRVMASGVQDENGRYIVDAARDIAVSVGRFATAEGVADGGGRPVQVLIGAHDGIDDPQRYLDPVIRSIELFSQAFGPYPWPTYTLAITPELSGGIEFPMHVLQGPGTQGRTTSHEVAHMWFYGLVGNNQALHPWLDEGLASYAEGRFEGTLGSMASREIPGDGVGRAGEPMTYWEGRPGSYYRSVYVQTAAALSRLGPVEQVDCMLANYVARNAHQIATPEALHAEAETFFPGWRDALAPAGLAPAG